jgi:ubiquitin-conjugating enzyme E2 D/E
MMMRVVCVGNDVLVSNWSPTLNVRYIFTTLHELLKSPNTDTPLEPEIAQVWSEDRKKFDKIAKEHTAKHAS